MKLGVYIDLRRPPGSSWSWPETYALALELCEEAEHLGADSIWLSEHHMFSDGYLPQPLTFAAAVAARTRRVRIGTAILIAPLREAAQIVEEATVVDLVSNGRLDLGLGGGYRQPEFELFGRDVSTAFPDLFRRTGEVRCLLGQGAVTPPPAQDPLPLWIGCNGPKGARRVGEMGERLLSVNPPTFDAYREGLEAGGHDTKAIRQSGPVTLFLSDDPDRDWPVVSNYWGYQWDTYRAAAAQGSGEAPERSDPDRYRERGLSAGLRGCTIATPAEAATELRRIYGGKPVETIFTWGWLPGIPHELVRRHVELACCELGPMLATDP